MLRAVVIAVGSACLALGVPVAAGAASSIQVAVAPAVATAVNTLTVTIASDDPSSKRVLVYGRTDDGRPCEATAAAFQAGSTARALFFAAEAQVAPTMTGTAKLGRGPLRVCAYLETSPSLATLAVQDTVVQLAAPTATLAITASPNPVPFGSSSIVGVTGVATAAGHVEAWLVPAGTGCDQETAGEQIGSAAAEQGAFAASFEHQPSLRDGTLCASFTADDFSLEPIARVTGGTLVVDVGGEIAIESSVAGLSRLTVTGRVIGAGPDSGLLSASSERRGVECRVGARDDAFRVTCELSVGRWCTAVLGADELTWAALKRCRRSGRARAVQLRLRAKLASGAEVARTVTLDLGAAIDAYGLVVPGASIGGVRLGMGRAELEALAAGPLDQPSRLARRAYHDPARIWGDGFFLIRPVLFHLGPDGTVDAVAMDASSATGDPPVGMLVRVGTRDLPVFRFREIEVAARASALRCRREVGGRVGVSRFDNALRCSGAGTLLAATSTEIQDGGAYAAALVGTPPQLRAFGFLVNRRFPGGLRAPWQSPWPV